MRSRFILGKNNLISECGFLIPLAFSLVVDTCVLQPPIATLGETTSSSQVLSKGPIVRACWCAIRAKP
jgi:hypothetical protein